VLNSRRPCLLASTPLNHVLVLTQSCGHTKSICTFRACNATHLPDRKVAAFVWLQIGLCFSWNDSSRFVHSRGFANVWSYTDYGQVLVRLKSQSELRLQNGQVIVFDRPNARAKATQPARRVEGGSPSDVPSRSVTQGGSSTSSSQPQGERATVRMVPKRPASDEAARRAEIQHPLTLKVKTHHKAIFRVFSLIFRIASQTSGVCVVLCLRNGCLYVQSTSGTNGTESSDPRHATPMS
jgi:hypothetical protein